MNVINFTVQIEGSLGDVPYAKHLIRETLRNYAVARVTFEAESSDWDSRRAPGEEYEAWIHGEISL